MVPSGRSVCIPDDARLKKVVRCDGYAWRSDDQLGADNCLGAPRLQCTIIEWDNSQGVRSEET